jgi:hypothetical protein
MGPTRQPLEREERGGKALADWLGLGPGREGEARGKWAKQAEKNEGGGEKVSIFFSKYIFLKLIFQKKFEFKTLYKKIPHIT